MFAVRPRRRAVTFAILAARVSLAAALVWAAPAPPAAAQPQPARFYFFSPDWRPGDLNKLTERVQLVLANQGLDVTFQAFARYEDFLTQVRNTPPDFLIAPSWFEDTAQEPPALPLRVIARPVRGGRTTYRKALMTREGIDSIDDLTQGSIAATVHSMGPGNERAVLDAFHLDAGTAKVLAVPKDVDALLALSFGQVDAALVTAQQYELLARTNPAVERLEVLAFSPEIALPALYAAGSSDAGFGEHLVTAFTGLADTAAGQEILAMLGYDAFTPETAGKMRAAGKAAGTRPAAALGGFTGAAPQPDAAGSAAPRIGSQPPAGPLGNAGTDAAPGPRGTP